MNMFRSVSMRRPGRNKFDLSHEKKMSFNMGDLIPIMCTEVVPGDKFRVDTEILLRMAPMLAPVMHRVNVWTHYFFVPNRLIWDEWETFITGGKDGTSAPVFPHTFFNTGTLKMNGKLDPNDPFGGTLTDYLGLPSFVDNDSLETPVSLLPFRAYQTIYNEYYRDQNLSEPVAFPLTSGFENSSSVTQELSSLRRRAWEKDYFTSALPWPQRGPEVLMPMEGTASVNYLQISKVVDTNGSFPGVQEDLGVTAAGDLAEGGINDPASYRRLENIDTIDIDGASTTITDLRRSLKLQEWLEKNARGGARYIEQMLSHFGVRSSDSRLQRPEYLGGGKAPVTISEVLNTTGTTELPQGNMAGHGLGIGRTNGFRKYFEEHGIVMGIMSVLPRTAYQQGMPRMWSRSDKFDYYWPEFQHIGEQEIKNKELYLSTNQLDNEETFGYAPRYSEYKYEPSTVHGDFRGNLSYWHMGRIFSAPPSLNESFVTSDPTHRIFAVEDPDVHKLYCQLYNRVDALRPMAYFGDPKLI